MQLAFLATRLIAIALLVVAAGFSLRRGETRAEGAASVA
jgi:hypothetical protein